MSTKSQNIVQKNQKSGKMIIWKSDSFETEMDAFFKCWCVSDVSYVGCGDQISKLVLELIIISMSQTHHWTYNRYLQHTDLSTAFDIITTQQLSTRQTIYGLFSMKWFGNEFVQDITNCHADQENHQSNFVKFVGRLGSIEKEKRNLLSTESENSAS